MPRSPSKLTARSQLRQLDSLLKPWQPPRREHQPEHGWIESIREALGMTQRDFARRARMHPTMVQRVQEGEQRRTLTLATLVRAADALECDFVYALVPRAGSLTETLKSRARLVAKAATHAVADTMALEDQTPESDEKAAQERDVADELFNDSWSHLWRPLPGENDAKQEQ